MPTGRENRRGDKPEKVAKPKMQYRKCATCAGRGLLLVGSAAWCFFQTMSKGESRPSYHGVFSRHGHMVVACCRRGEGSEVMECVMGGMVLELREPRQRGQKSATRPEMAKGIHGLLCHVEHGHTMPQQWWVKCCFGPCWLWERGVACWIPCAKRGLW